MGVGVGGGGKLSSLYLYMRKQKELLNQDQKSAGNQVEYNQTSREEEDRIVQEKPILAVHKVTEQMRKPNLLFHQ